MSNPPIPAWVTEERLRALMGGYMKMVSFIADAPQMIDSGVRVEFGSRCESVKMGSVSVIADIEREVSGFKGWLDGVLADENQKAASIIAKIEKHKNTSLPGLPRIDPSFADYLG